MKFRKKPVVIEAYQTDKEIDIETLEGTMHANVGDWIITGVNGEQYPCKPDIFEKTYERIDTKRRKINTDAGKVIKAFENCFLKGECRKCPYTKQRKTSFENSCTDNLCLDVVALLKDQNELIKQYKNACKSCKSRLEGVKPF